MYVLYVPTYVTCLHLLQDHFRLLDPTDPFGNQLQLLDTDTGTSQEARTISGDTLPKFNNTPDVKGPLTCVHVANMGNSKTVSTIEPVLRDHCMYSRTCIERPLYVQ